MIGSTEENNKKLLAQYSDQLLNDELQRIDGVTRDREKVEAFLCSCARYSSKPALKTNILSDITQSGKTIHLNTVNAYMTALKQLCIIDNLQAWSPRLRSKTTIRLSDTLHFTDPSLAAYFLPLRPRDLLFDPYMFEQLFESMVVRDLRVYAQALRGHVSHYRDRNGLEADAIIHLPNGQWAAIEVKLSLYHVDEAAKNLLALKDKIDTDYMHSPSFLMVVTATEYAYRRNDGVYVVPLGCLRP